MFKIGQKVKYKSEYASEGEQAYIHIIKEIRLNPVTGTETRFLIETINTSLTFNPQEVVDDFMIEEL